MQSKGPRCVGVIHTGRKCTLSRASAGKSVCIRESCATHIGCSDARCVRDGASAGFRLCDAEENRAPQGGSQARVERHCKGIQKPERQEAEKSTFDAPYFFASNRNQTDPIKIKKKAQVQGSRLRVTFVAYFCCCLSHPRPPRILQLAS